jgi:hypothetical protein
VHVRHLGFRTTQSITALPANTTISQPILQNPQITSQAVFAAGSNIAPSITAAGDTNTGIYFPAADTIAFTEGGVERMRITDVGNLGIGTITSSEALSIVRPLGVAAGVETAGNGNTLDTASMFVGQGGAGQGFVFNRANTALIFATNSLERMRIPAAGGLQAVTCISVGNATPSNSGAGITFPATQSASTNANTLDDYEEGTWTPNLTFGGSSTGITYSVQDGRYTKIGRIVTLQAFIRLSSRGSATGEARITSVPFLAYRGDPSSNPMSPGLLSLEADGSSWPTATYGLVWNDGNIYIRYATSTGWAGVQQSNFTNTTAIYWAATYETTT